MTFGEYFSHLRKEKHFTQEYVASKIGKTKMLVSGVETGRNGAFLDNDLEIIAKEFRLSKEERKQLFYEALKARKRVPAHILRYMKENDEAYNILEIMAQENMKSDLLKKIKRYVEKLKNAKYY